MVTLNGLNEKIVLQYLKQEVYNHEYISKPHQTLDYLINTGDKRILLEYTLQQPIVSYAFLTGLNSLSLNIISSAIYKGEINTKLVEAAFHVVVNLCEELKDPAEGKSHIKLLADLQNKLKEHPNEKLEFKTSEVTIAYSNKMLQGMSNVQTGLLYLATMETWMKPEYDFLEKAVTKAGIPREKQTYFDANRNADAGHVAISIKAALELSSIGEFWNLNEELINDTIQASINDRSEFWDQFSNYSSPRK